MADLCFIAPMGLQSNRQLNTVNIYILQIYTWHWKLGQNTTLPLYFKVLDNNQTESPKLKRSLQDLKICNLSNTFNAKYLDVLILVMALLTQFVYFVVLWKPIYFWEMQYHIQSDLQMCITVKTGAMSFYYTV